MAEPGDAASTGDDTATDGDAAQPFVRRARLVDAAAFAGVQHRSWQEAAREHDLPQPPALDDIERAWERALTVPPTPRHRCWVAVDRSASGEMVTGVAALAPASDPDLDGDRCVELVLLTVDPTARGLGHGSRLLTAAMESAQSQGDTEAVAWIASDDDAMRRFLEETGWAADGAFRTVTDDGAADQPAHDLRQVRLATSLQDEGQPRDQ